MVLHLLVLFLVVSLSVLPLRTSNAGATNQKPGKLVLSRDEAGPCDPHLHHVVPEDHYFVVGDNRSNSNDSRYRGSVPAENVRGKVIGLVSPLGRLGGVR